MVHGKEKVTQTGEQTRAVIYNNITFMMPKHKVQMLTLKILLGAHTVLYQLCYIL